MSQKRIPLEEIFESCMKKGASEIVFKGVAITAGYQLQEITDWQDFKQEKKAGELNKENVLKIEDYESDIKEIVNDNSIEEIEFFKSIFQEAINRKLAILPIEKK